MTAPAPATLPRTAVDPPVPSARSRPRASRDPFLDNAKFLLVVLVVIGHNWGPLIDDMRAVRAAWLVLYAFHMPAFILLCGYFSRHFTGRPDQIRKLALTVLAPYLIFETLYSVLYTLVWGRPFAITPTTPTYVCWFLIALFLWRLTAPVWKAVPQPVAVAAALSLAAGTTAIHYELALPRVLQFLPWFVLGLQLRPDHFQLLRGPLVRACSLVAVLGASAGAWWIAPGADPLWMPMQHNHAELRLTVPQYLVVRLVLFVVAAALVAAFFAWVPRHRAAYTTLGAATLYPYLLHGLVVQAAQAYGLHDLVAWGGLIGAALLTLLSVALVVGLSTRTVRRVACYLVDPRSLKVLWTLFQLTRPGRRIPA
jgi:fucose 4-O-acetylase-like acetyltransferase